MTDNEMYQKMQFLQDDDEIFGCYIEGHHDLEQFKRVANAFIDNECTINALRQERTARKGYFKVVPRGESLILHFSEGPMRGAKKIMEIECY